MKSMSWKLGFVMIGARWPGTEAGLLHELGFAALPAPREVHIADTLELFPSTSAVAVGDDYTLVLNGLLPYDLAYEPPFSAPLDERLKALSKLAPVLVGFIDGRSATSGFCVYEAGRATRARKIVSGRAETDYGAPFEEERTSEDAEAKIFALTGRWLRERWLREPLDDFIIDAEIFMNVYDT
jgi:hypothetical protein